MNITLDKKMRIAEIAASLITLVLVINELRGQVFSFSFPVLEEISIFFISLMFLFGKIRNAPWNRIIGVLYAVMIISKVGRIDYVASTIANFNDVPDPSQVVAPIGFDIIFIIGAVICVLMYLGVVRFRKRRGLLILMYVFIVFVFFGLSMLLLSFATLRRVLVIVWGICFHNENAETGCKKGKAARTAVFLFIPVTLVLEFAHYMEAVMTLRFLSQTTMDVSAVTAFIVSMSPFIELISFACIMIFPLLLFDKKFEIDETAEKTS